MNIGVILRDKNGRFLKGSKPMNPLKKGEKVWWQKQGLDKLLNNGKTRFKKGHIPWSKEKKGISLNTGKTHFKKGCISLMKGKHHSEESNHKNRLAHLGKMLGSNHWNWKGGISPENHKLRNTIEYRQWQKAVFKRDYWTCQICGIKGKKIWADHIKPFALYPESRFDINNGRTVCVDCALKLPTHGSNVYKFQGGNQI